MRKKIQKVTQKIQDEMSSDNSFYARGLSSEGYAGGYRDALYDIQLILNDVIPDGRNWWRDD